MAPRALPTRLVEKPGPVRNALADHIAAGPRWKYQARDGALHMASPTPDGSELRGGSPCLCTAGPRSESRKSLGDHAGSRRWRENQVGKRPVAFSGKESGHER